MCEKTEMLLTDNKDYEKRNQESAKSSKKEGNLKQANSIKQTCHSILQPYKEAKLIDFKPTFFYASCQHKHSNVGFPYALLPDFSSEPISSDNDDTKSPSDDIVDDVSLADERTSMEEDGTSSAPRESDATDQNQELVGRVKKLRSRKDRSLTSPR